MSDELTVVERFRLMAISVEEFDDNEVGLVFMETKVSNDDEITQMMGILENHRPALLKRLDAGEKDFSATKTAKACREKQPALVGANLTQREPPDEEDQLLGQLKPGRFGFYV